MKQRIYIDTSVVGGYFDEEFKEATIKLFERLDNKEIIFVVSNLLDLELINAPDRVKQHLFQYSSEKFERVELTEEAIQLADKYIQEKVVGKTSLEDCRHIALATINKVDVLASWNFKHIVNLDRIKGYNSVNLKLGYSIIEIRSPKDLVKYGPDDPDAEHQDDQDRDDRVREAPHRMILGSSFGQPSSSAAAARSRWLA